MRCSVVGLGVFGRALAVKLARRGAEVIAVDEDINKVKDVSKDVTIAVKLDPTSEEELKGQGVHNVDVFVAAIENNFEANELAVVLAKKLGAPRVIARAADPLHARILELIGADEVVMPEEDAAERTYRKLLFPSLRAYFELVEGLSLAELPLPPVYFNKRLDQLNLPKKYGVTLVSVRRKEDGNETNFVPKWSDYLKEGDGIAVVGSDKDIARFLSDSQA